MLELHSDIRLFDPCSLSEFKNLDRQFRKSYGYSLPKEYMEIILKSNGIKHGQLTIYPCKANTEFSQTIFQANDELHDYYSYHYLCFGFYEDPNENTNDQMYVFDKRAEQYVGINLLHEQIFQTFKNDKEMFDYMFNLPKSKD